MAAGNVGIVYPLDTEMDGMVCSHHVYKSVWSPVIGYLGEGACCPIHTMDLQWQ